MIILLFVAVGVMILGALYLQDSGLFRPKRIKMFSATVVDESEDELYDNIGGTKTRFFKVYEYFDGEENRVIKSEKPMRSIDGDVGRDCIIYVDSKTRRAMEKKDVVSYRVKGAVMFAVAICIIVCYIYIKNNVPGAVSL